MTDQLRCSQRGSGTISEKRSEWSLSATRVLESADRVYGMTDEHVLRIMMAFPEHAGKIASLGVSVPDPYGGDLDEYEKTLDIIIEAVRKL